MPCLGCLLIFVALSLPRLTLFFLAVLKLEYLSFAYSTLIFPLLGFFFMPYTTLFYAVAMHHGGLDGFWLFLFVLGVLLDTGQLGLSKWRWRRSE